MFIQRITSPSLDLKIFLRLRSEIFFQFLKNVLMIIINNGCLLYRYQCLCLVVINLQQLQKCHSRQPCMIIILIPVIKAASDIYYCRKRFLSDHIYVFLTFSRDWNRVHDFRGCNEVCIESVYYVRLLVSSSPWYLWSNRFA